MSLIIVVMNQKGGSGKTTLVVNLAGAYKMLGKKVAVIDLDPQNSLRAYKNYDVNGDLFPAHAFSLASPLDPHEEAPKPAEVAKRIFREIGALAEVYDVLILDTSAQVNDPSVPAALSIADVGLVPVHPGALDMASTLQTWRTAQMVSGQNVDLITRVVLMGVDRSKAAHEMRNTIRNYPAWRGSVAKSEIEHRAAFPTAALYGGTVFSTNNGKAIAEMQLLVDEIDSLRNGVSA